MEQLTGELQAMVLELAADVARRCMASVTDGGLTDGHLQDNIPISGENWHIHASYYRDDDLVRIQGHRCEVEVQSIPALMMAMTGQRPHVPDEFEFMVPGAWVPRSSEGL